MLVRNTFFVKVLLQISINKLASLVSVETFRISFCGSNDLFTELFGRARCIRMLMHKVQMQGACLLFYKG